MLTTILRQNLGQAAAIQSARPIAAVIAVGSLMRR